MMAEDMSIHQLDGFDFNEVINSVNFGNGTNFLVDALRAETHSMQPGNDTDMLEQVASLAYPLRNVHIHPPLAPPPPAPLPPVQHLAQATVHGAMLPVVSGGMQMAYAGVQMMPGMHPGPPPSVYGHPPQDAQALWMQAQMQQAQMQYAQMQQAQMQQAQIYQEAHMLQAQIYQKAAADSLKQVVEVVKKASSPAPPGHNTPPTTPDLVPGLLPGLLPAGAVPAPPAAVPAPPAGAVPADPAEMNASLNAMYLHMQTLEPGTNYCAYYDRLATYKKLMKKTMQ